VRLREDQKALEAARKELESRRDKGDKSRSIMQRNDSSGNESTTHKISITLPNNQTREFTMASGEDAAGLGVFLAQLGDARSRS